MLKPLNTITRACSALSLLAVTMGANAATTEHTHTRASVIEITAQQGQNTALADFLSVGAQLVQDNEPDTLFWSALQTEDKNTFVIFDAFGSQAAQDAHFAGKIPKALSESAATLVKGGWNDGVLPNIHNADIIASKVGKNTQESIKIATFIPLKAKPGQEQKLAELLEQGAQIVTTQEPGTLHWFAVHFGDDRFGIVDFFADQAGVDAHFNGGVAAAMKQNASTLVEGGWEQGVLAGIQTYQVIELLQH
ncbi:hypothetical protein F0224_18350 [Vibrio coralliilyticus]|uniref:putative quinol monooxygenase n=1 Tax=Vibrio coralliilyticus TaxID=190893 RepID=UPI0005127379|nr:antibiotic biosynthesis monooxygenase [Vibrio coralliilyticus]AIU66257.1 hypothetical protein JV59_28090 [Vibrio coralliilyticus]ANW25216.1 hypothetical protein BA953_14000 [Vibrio coralliilyticus]MCC2523446.1 hypothetical protein [Vibrio coralliilyticus]NOI77648.1 hypothetical protein [Vibrio coralliilyticus]PAW02686.1 hypothetical protein CKJ79_15850 [Vibrio coralliilyticus]